MGWPACHRHRSVARAFGPEKESTDDEGFEGGGQGWLEFERRPLDRKVVKKLTSPMKIKGHKVAESKDNPEYLVETENGKRAAHKPEALSKT